jgi:hypothetical protein
MFASSVVIDDLDFLRAGRRPNEADPELVVYADAVLARAIALQHFKPVARRHPKIAQPGCTVEHRQLSHCRPLEIGKTPDTFAVE